MDWMPHAIREGILTVLLISGPLVVLAAGLGLTIGVLQAATQIQEQTLGSAVKILGIFLALIIFGVFIFQYMQEYSKAALNKAFRLVPTLESSPLPPREIQRARNKKDQMIQANQPYQFEPPSSSGFSSGGPNLSAFGGLANEPLVVPVNQGASQEIPTLPSPGGPIQARPGAPNFQTQDLRAATITEPQVPAITQPGVATTNTPATQSPAATTPTAAEPQTPTVAESEAAATPPRTQAPTIATPTETAQTEEETTPPVTAPSPSAREKRAQRRRERRGNLDSLLNKIQSSIDDVKEEQ